VEQRKTPRCFLKGNATKMGSKVPISRVGIAIVGAMDFGKRRISIMTHILLCKVINKFFE